MGGPGTDERRRAGSSSSPAATARSPVPPPSAFLGRPVEAGEGMAAGRLERRDGEIRDGAHTPEAVRYIAPRLPAARLDRRVDPGRQARRRDARAPRAPGDTFVATESSHPAGACRPTSSPSLARAHFRRVVAERRPRAGGGAGARAREPGSRHRLPVPPGRPRGRRPGRVRTMTKTSGQAERLRARRVHRSRARGDRVRSRVSARKTSSLTELNRMIRTIPLFQTTAPTDTSDDLFAGVRDFFESDVWLVVRNVAIFFAVAFWLASAYWVYKDAKRRIEDPWLIAVAVALGIFPPFLGPLIYMLFRPPEYLEDVGSASSSCRPSRSPSGTSSCAPCAARRSKAGSSSARSARRVCVRRAVTATGRSIRSGRCAPTAKRPSSSRRRLMGDPGLSGPYDRRPATSKGEPECPSARSSSSSPMP